MPKPLPKPAQQLREYLLQPSERNEDLAISYFRSLYPDAFRRQSDAANADGYVPGHFLLELKGDPNAWYPALFQALAYEKKRLAFSLAWISTSAYSPKTKPGFARHEVKTSCMSFHQGTVTGLFSSPEASTIGR